MKLLACPTCHAQYDVEGVAEAAFSCRCGARLENRPAESRDAPVVRCGSCGAALAPEAPACSFCGSAVLRRPGAAGPVCPECLARTPERSRFCTACGVAFRPEPIPSETQERICPGCGALLSPQSVAGIGILACGGCQGLWIPEGRLEQLLARARDEGPGGQPVAGLAPRLRGGNPAGQRVQYRRCPECHELMLRRNFQRRSGIVVDVCRHHGTWLDADELEQIAGYLRARRSEAELVAGREPSPAPTEPGPADAAFTRILAEHGKLGPREPAPEPSSLLDVLFALLR